MRIHTLRAVRQVKHFRTVGAYEISLRFFVLELLSLDSLGVCDGFLTILDVHLHTFNLVLKLFRARYFFLHFYICRVAGTVRVRDLLLCVLCVQMQLLDFRGSSFAVMLPCFAILYNLWSYNLILIGCLSSLFIFNFLCFMSYLG